LFAGIEADGLLIFADSSQRIPEFFVQIAQQAMQVSIVFVGQQFLDMVSSLGEISEAAAGQPEIVLVTAIGGIDAIGGLQQGNGVGISALPQIEFAELMICCEASGLASQRCAQVSLGSARRTPAAGRI
jgi:hypothetical protein